MGRLEGDIVGKFLFHLHHRRNKDEGKRKSFFLNQS